MAKHVNARILHKIDTEEHWSLAQNFIPLKGEMIIYEPDKNHPYPRIKTGDGVTNVSLLPFLDNIEKKCFKYDNVYCTGGDPNVNSGNTTHYTMTRFWILQI